MVPNRRWYCSKKKSKLAAINRDFPLKGKSFFSKVVTSGKKIITPYKVQYVQVTQDPKRYLPLKSITRRIPCNSKKGGCRHRGKFSSTHDMRGKHIHRRTTQQNPHTGKVAITSCLDLTANTEKNQLGIHGMNTFAGQNSNQGINSAPSTSSGDFTKNNGGTRFSSAHVLQTKIVARRTPFVKPNVVTTATSTGDNTTLTTDTVNMQREELIVATTLESHDFDTGISTCSLDTALGIECRTQGQDTQREESDNQVPVSSGLIKDSLDPVLTVCNLPPVLITSNINLGANGACSTPQYNRNMPSTSSRSSQRATQEEKTEMVPHHTHYLQHITSENQAEVVAPAVSTSSIGIAIDAACSTPQYNQSVPSMPQPELHQQKKEMLPHHTLFLKHLTSENQGEVAAIASSSSIAMDPEISTPQYSGMMPCLHAQESQIKPDNLNMKVLPYNMPYLEQAVGSTQTVNTTSLGHPIEPHFSASQYKRNISLTEKLSQIVKRDLDSKLSFRRKQSLKTNIDVTESETHKINKKTYKYNKKNECGGSQHNKSIKGLQKKIVKRQTYVVKSNCAPRCKNLKRNTSGIRTSTTIDMDFKNQNEDNIPHCNLSMPSLEANDAVEISLDTKVQQSSDRQYLKSQIPVIATIPTSEENPIKAATAKTPQKRKKKKEMPILGIIENDLIDLDITTCSLDSDAEVDVTSQNKKQLKEIPVTVSASTDSEMSEVASIEDLVSNNAQGIMIERDNNCLLKDTAVLPVSQDVCVNLDDIFNEGQISVVENEKKSLGTDTSGFLCPTSEAIGENLDDISKEVQKIVENAKICPKKVTSVIPTPTAQSVGDNLDVISDKVQESVVENENQRSKKDTYLSILTPETVEEQLDRIFNDENTSAQNSTPTDSTRCEIPSSVDLTNSGVNPGSSASELPIVLCTSTDDPVSDTEDTTPHFDTESQQSPITCEGQSLKAQSEVHENASVVKEANKTAGNKKDDDIIESTPASPQPGTSQKVTPTSKNSNEISEQVLDPTDDKDQSSENDAWPSEEQAEPKAASNLKCRFFRSPRGKRMLLVNGIRYRVNNISSDKIRWRCSSHERYGCKAKLHTIGNKIVYFVNEHVTFSPDEGVDDLEPYGIIDPETYY